MRRKKALLALCVLLFLAGCTNLSPLMWEESAQINETHDIWVAPGTYKIPALEIQSTNIEPVLPTDPETGLRYYPHLVVVALKEGQFTDTTIANLAKKYGLSVKGKIKPVRMVLFGVPEGVDLQEIRRRLASEASVEEAGLDYIFEFDSTSTSTLEPLEITNDFWMPLAQWGLFKIGFNEVASSVLPTSAPVIAVVDSGIDYTHPDITKNRVILGPDYYDGDMDPLDTYGHGTHVAGIAAAVTNNDLGVAGVSGRSKLLAIRVGGGSGIPIFAGTAGIVYAADNAQVKVINLSWGGSQDLSFIRSAVAYATAKGKLIVASAGNENTTEPRYPAAYPDVLAVGASDTNDARASFSNYGTYVDIAAPGVDIYSTFPGSDYRLMSGTSMAAPFVAGAAALVWGKWPTLTRAEVAYLLTATGDPVSGFPSGVRRLDIANIFRYKLGNLPPPGGALLGIVIDAHTGAPLAQATVTAKSGSVTRTAKTRYDGTFTITNMPAGWYTVSASKSGYATTTDFWLWRIYDAKWTYLVYLALPKNQGSNVYTAVLRWFGYEDYGCEELDTLLWLPDSLPDHLKYKIYFVDRGHEKVHPYARLLRDEPTEMPSRTWMPLYCEALTFQTKYTGAYRLVIYNWDWQDNESWDYSDAIVTLYRGSTQLANYWVGNASGTGWRWIVCEVSGTNVYGINALTTSYPGFYGEDEILAAQALKPDFVGLDIPAGTFVPNPIAAPAQQPLPEPPESRRPPTPDERVPR